MFVCRCSCTINGLGILRDVLFRFNSRFELPVEPATQRTSISGLIKLIQSLEFKIYLRRPKLNGNEDSSVVISPFEQIKIAQIITLLAAILQAMNTSIVTG
jgi:hypothetical protein